MAMRWLPRPPIKKISPLCRALHKRRNYLFAGADSGGERAATMYSLIGTARLNGLEPEAYLAYVLERIDELLPCSVASSLPSTAHVEPIR